MKPTTTPLSNLFLKTFGALSLVLFSLAASAQIPNYGFIGETVNKRSAATGEILYSGHLLEDSLIGQNEIVKVTMRYASDTVAYTQLGVLHPVERLMDFYYPSKDIILEYGGGLEINNLPLMVVLHSGQGTKETTADYARYWAAMGYTVIAPTVRSDRLGVNYCMGYTKTIYTTVQDVRAALRVYSKLFDYSKLDPQELQPLLSSREEGELVDHLRQSRSDGMSIFMVGKSYGGSAAYHTSTRVNQQDFEEYLWADTPYIINGAVGAVDLGSSGLLDDVGIPFIKNYPLPYDRFRGIVCRTAGVLEDMESIDYSVANHVPGSFIQNTCDALVPYHSRSFVHNEGLCDADVTLPDGTQDTSMVLFGSDAITQHMEENGVYSELITFCGGGHTSNMCSQDISDFHSTKFITRILSGNYQQGTRFERVYRYHFQNYSDQCCRIGDEYGFMLKCSCDESNPYNVIDLPYLSPDECSESATCDLVLSLCDMEPPGLVENFGESVSGQEAFTMELINISDGTFFKIMAPYRAIEELRIVDAMGRVLYAAPINLDDGMNILPIPAKLPTAQILIARLGSVKAVKFQLAP